MNNKFNELEALRNDTLVKHKGKLYYNKESKNSKKSKIKSRKEIQYKAQKVNNYTNSSFKMISLIFLLTVIGFIIYFFVVLLQTGIEPIVENDYITLDYIIFGPIYNPGADKFAVGFMLVNTLYTSFFALLLATPFSVATALAITRLAPKSISSILSFGIVGLAAVPSVVYGLFVGEAINGAIAGVFGSEYASGTVLSVITTLSIMITPTITLITITTINNIDKSVEEGAYALGATKAQTNLKITLKEAMPGIFAGMALGIGRALGEATAVTLAATPVNQGIQLGWLESASNLTQWMLAGFGELAVNSTEYQMRFTMGIILLVAIVLVISSIKFAENKYINSATNSFRKQKKAISEIKLFENNTSISTKKSVFTEWKIKYYKWKYQGKLISTKEIPEMTIEQEKASIARSVRAKRKVLSTRPSTDEIIKINKKNSNYITGTIYTMSIVVTSMLVAIVVFLIVTGSSQLDWHFMTSQYTDVQNVVFSEQDKNIEYEAPESVSSNENKEWVKSWGFSLYYDVESSGKTHLYITDINKNSPLIENSYYFDINSNTKNNNFSADDLYEIELSSFRDVNGTIITPDTSGWNNNNWDDIENKSFLADWINNQESLVYNLYEVNGGIRISFINTIVLMLITVAIAVPVGIFISIYINEFIKSNKTKETIKNFLTIFSGLPTLMIGLLTAAIFIPLISEEYRILAASFGLAFITLPTIIIQITNALDDVPKHRINASLSLGASQTTTFFKIKLPSIFPALLSTTILAMGRVLGESAALVMFYMLNPADTFNMSGGATLATHIYYIIISSEEADPESAAAIALVIIALIGLIFMVSKQAEERKWYKFGVWSLITLMLVLSIIVISLPMFWIGISILILVILYEIANGICIAKTKQDMFDVIYKKLKE